MEQRAQIKLTKNRMRMKIIQLLEKIKEKNQSKRQKLVVKIVQEI
jgi:hypothetical protein